jgi:hypothetical protein
MDNKRQMIMDPLESFYRHSGGEVIEYLEKMMCEWYQHYARDHYHIDHINEVVSNTFRVSDLLLKLNDAMIALKEEQGLEAGHPRSDHYDFLYAS